MNIHSEASLKELYFKYRNDFLAMTARYTLDEEAKLDAYQDAIVAWIEGMQKGKINVEKSQKAYILGIARNILVDKIKADIRKRELGEKLLVEQEEQETYSLDAIDLNHRQLQLQELLGKLGERCQQILKLFYYRKYSIEAIRLTMGYDNDNVAKSHKSRCLKQLKEKAKGVEWH